MATHDFSKPLTVSLTSAFAILTGGGIVLAFLLVPTDILEIAVLDSGLPALLPAAEPPLGWTARAALGITVGGAGGAAAWLGAFLLLGGDGMVRVRRPRWSAIATPRVPRVPSFKLPSLPSIAALLGRRGGIAEQIGVPVLRRADAHPDAPARAPLVATRELGAPFLAVRATARSVEERPLPSDLDAPLAAFDPDAIPQTAAEPVRAVTSLAPRIGTAIHADGERFEAFELPRPAPTPGVAPIAAPRTDATIHALLDRLERGVGGRAMRGDAGARRVAG